jgi:hypothetical protein
MSVMCVGQTDSKRFKKVLIRSRSSNERGESRLEISLKSSIFPCRSEFS